MGLRQFLHRYVPAHFDDPLGLAARLVRSRDPAAWFAMAAALGGAASAPLDVALAPIERRLLSIYASRRPPRHPLILICGAPRSGTTVVYQTLVRHLPVAYFSNLSALFPRSPLAAQRLFGRFLRPQSGGFHSYYGRTQGLAGTNDALNLWDRWLGADRSTAATQINERQRQAMVEFFTACDVLWDRPLVNKNNSLNLSAHLVAECLPHARFICITRDRRSLAQSLYRARCDIHGKPSAAYGASPRRADVADDPVRDVCQQAISYDDVNGQQRTRLGRDRFWLVSYEEFCRSPISLLRRVAQDVLGDERLVVGSPPASFRISSADRVPPDVAARIDAELAAPLRQPLAACG